MPNFGNLIISRCREMPKYGTIRLLWPCQPWYGREPQKVFRLNAAGHEMITVLMKVKRLGEPERLLVKDPGI